MGLNEAPPREAAAAPARGLLRRAYQWTIRWAETPYGVWALFVLAFAEASFFPIPPDVLLIALALGMPRRSLRFAAVCTAGSVLGGCLGYAIGAVLFEAIGRRIVEFYHYTEQFEKLQGLFAQHGFLYIFIAALTPIPYKVFTIAAGVSHARVPLAVLVAASMVGRGLRFFAVGALFWLCGPPIKRFIDRYFNLLTILFVVLLGLGFACVRLFGGAHRAKEGAAAAAPGAVGVAAEGGTRKMLSENAKRELLRIARQTVEAAVRKQPPPRFDIKDPELMAHRGAFVTLKTRGELRGCIGQFIADRPLWQVVQQMAVASATQDPRFFGYRLRPEELGELEIEISVLSPLKRISDPLKEIELGKHGIYIKRGSAAGCFLPQVATETGWTKEEFLSHCCAGKAGLPPDAWKDPKTELYTFTAEVFHDVPSGSAGS